MSTTLGCKDIKIRKSEFVAKTQFLYILNSNITRKIILSSFVSALAREYLVCQVCICLLYIHAIQVMSLYLHLKLVLHIFNFQICINLIILYSNISSTIYLDMFFIAVQQYIFCIFSLYVVYCCTAIFLLHFLQICCYCCTAIFLMHFHCMYNTLLYSKISC